MKSDQFQDLVLQHLGEQKVAHEDIQRRLGAIEAQTKLTNGTVSKHQTWIDNANGRFAIIASIAVMVGGAIVNWIIDILKGK